MRAVSMACTLLRDKAKRLWCAGVYLEVDVTNGRSKVVVRVYLEVDAKQAFGLENTCKSNNEHAHKYLSVLTWGHCF